MKVKEKIKKVLPQSAFSIISRAFFRIRYFYNYFILFPLIIRKNTSDKKVFEQIFLFKEYDLKIPFEPKLIVDAGANTGFSSIYFSRRFPKAKVFAIEPEISNFNTLVFNTRRYVNIICLRKGLWNIKANLKIANPDSKNWGFMTEKVNSICENLVDSITLYELISSTNFETIDLLKIDIEGAEKELFSDNFENWLPKTKLIIIEIHDKKKPGCGKAVYEAIEKYNFGETSFGESKVFINLDFQQTILE